MSSGTDPDPVLSQAERERLEAIRRAERLADLVGITGAADEHDAYFEAKELWADLQDRVLPPATTDDDVFPGDSVVVDGHTFHVHGVTHADTDAERAFVREHVSRFLDAGATVYCEQGIRPMYFEDFDGACEMDDYRWALAQCRERDIESHLDSHEVDEFDGFFEDLGSVTTQFRDAVFSLLHSRDDGYGDAFRGVLGALASDFLMSHEDVARAQDFESFALSKQAAENPKRLGELQRYYNRVFLPQPLEREWLRRHDPELEIVSHARNERMADYAVYHNQTTDVVHLVVGAAHQPGVVYYLERHRDGYRDAADFEPVE